MIKLIVYLLLMTGTLYAQIYCPELDYSARFGPVRDQDGTGLCWSFTAAALLDEQRCKDSPKLCGKQLSPIDITRCNWTYANVFEDSKSQGGFSADAVNCALKDGVCPEENARFDAFNGLECLIQEKHFDQRCNVKKIIENFNRWKNMQRTFICSGKSVEHNLGYDFENFLNSVMLSMSTPSVLLEGRDLTKIFNQSENAEEFLKNLYATPSCVKNRYKPSGRFKVLGAQSYVDGRINFIREALINRNSSVGISIDLSILDSEKYKESSMHALLVVGMRRNPETHQCEMKLRNSWGAYGAFNDWIPVETLKGAIHDAYYLQQ